MFLLALAPTSAAAEARGARVLDAHAYLAQPLDRALILLPKVIDELARVPGGTWPARNISTRLFIFLM